jgi:hypothetical protein
MKRLDLFSYFKAPGFRFGFVLGFAAGAAAVMLGATLLIEFFS